MEKLNKEIILQKLSEIDKNEYGFSKIGLFGSYSKNEQTENSDIDILVEMEINYSFKDLTFNDKKVII